MFKLNAKFDADSLLYLLSHFECDGHTVHTLTQRHLLPPLSSTMKLLFFTHVHSSPFLVAARLHWCHANCYYINNGLTFSRQTLCVCVCVCIHICICTHIYIYIYIYVYTHRIYISFKLHQWKFIGKFCLSGYVYNLSTDFKGSFFSRSKEELIVLVLALHHFILHHVTVCCFWDIFYQFVLSQEVNIFRVDTFKFSFSCYLPC